MMVAAMIPAMAAFAYDTSVSVEGLQAGDTVKYYQVLDWDQTNGTWKLAAGFTSLASDTVNFATDVVADIINGLNQDQANAIAALAADATVKYTDSNIAGTTSTYTLPATDDAAKLAAVGLYMGVITAGTPKTIYNPVFIGADFDDTDSTPHVSVTQTYGDEGIAKKQEITLTKTTSDANSAVDTAIDSRVGEEVTFYVDTQIPVFLDSYQNPSFVIYDNIETSGINLNADSIEITLGSGTSAKTYAKTASGEKLAYDANIFGVSATAGNAGEYTVTFVPNWLGGNETAVPVHIEYKGTITNAATFNVNEDDNTVTVTYSNGPGTEKGALKDRTNHYTFSIGAQAFGEDEANEKTYELVKVGVDEDGKPVVEKKKVSEWSEKIERHPLANATFALYPSTDSTCEGNPIATFTTGDDGIITFKGLDAGQYYIKETAAPSGYIKDDRIVSVKIDAFYETVTVPAGTDTNGVKYAAYDFKVLDHYTVTINNVSEYDSTGDEYDPATDAKVSTYTFENNGKGISTIKTTDTTVNDSDLINTKGVELPSTGGMGTTILYIGGSILVLAAAILLITKRRMSAND